MGAERVEYVHLPAGSSPQQIPVEPRRMLVLIDQDVETDWRHDVSRWIVASGCLYMMAWGNGCSSWDVSVDEANLELYDYGEIPDEQFVMTTWHDDEPLHEVFFFARVCTFHPVTPLPTLTIVDIRDAARESDILALYRAEKAGLLEDAFQDPTRLPFKDRVKILMRKK